MERERERERERESERDLGALDSKHGARGEQRGVGILELEVQRLLVLVQPCRNRGGARVRVAYIYIYIEREREKRERERKRDSSDSTPKWLCEEVEVEELVLEQPCRNRGIKTPTFADATYTPKSDFSNNPDVDNR